MFKIIQKEIEKEFEVGKTYKTKFATGDSFTISKIIRVKDNRIYGFEGTYTNLPHLTNCSLGPDRLIPEKEIVHDSVELCFHCGQPLIK